MNAPDMYPMEALRLPPHSVEAEQSVLAALLTDNAAWDRITDLIGPASFYRQDHRMIFEAIAQLIEANKPADVITVAERLKRDGKLADAGGFAHLQTITDSSVGAVNVRHYAEIIHERAILRGLAELSNSIADNCYSTQGRSANQILNEAESQVLAIAQGSTRARFGFKTITDNLSDVMSALDERSKNPGALVGISTGFDRLDELTTGLRRGDLIIVAGRPSMGKTSLALNIAEHVAIQQSLPALVFSMEMGGAQLAERMLASVARINAQSMRQGRLTPNDWDRINRALGKMNGVPLEIDETGGLSIHEVRSRARRMAHKYGELGLIVIDYIQLMSCPKQENRATEIGDITSGLKAMAKEFRVPVIALSQLNRGVEQRVDKRPVMSDLRESGAIEQDADMIAFIYRDEVYHPQTEAKGKAELIISKQRNGPIDTVPLTFINELTRFENYAGSMWPTSVGRKPAFREGE